jgi:SAM-dependent methyltransferase
MFAESLGGVVMQCYLEHEIRPRAVLSAVHGVLRPGGFLVIKVPNFASWNRSVRGQRWCGFRYPDHVNYFTPLSLKTMLLSTGFEIVQNRLFDHFPLADNLYMVSRK